MFFTRNQQLTDFNTFGINARAKEFYTIKSETELTRLLNVHDQFTVLGGGSNMLIKSLVLDCVAWISIPGIEIISKTNTRVELKVGAGENWHKLVSYCVRNGYGGLENLALIPGQAGSAPIQNIGAYGRELKDVLVSVDVVDTTDLKASRISANECGLGYRSSIFKTVSKGQYIITAIYLQLTNRLHQFYLDYGDIRASLERKEILNPKLEDVYNAVIAIRRSKLPDPSNLGNSGSFFKNPIICPDQLSEIKKKNATVKYFPVGKEAFKIPAAWLIESCGWKGKRIGDAGVYPKHALVLVNYGKATGAEIFDLACQIQASVKNKFGLKLEMEVNVL